MNAQKGTTIAYNQAVQTLTASQAAQTTVVQQLTAAAKAMADAQALLTPATQSAARHRSSTYRVTRYGDDAASG